MRLLVEARKGSLSADSGGALHGCAYSRLLGGGAEIYVVPRNASHATNSQFHLSQPHE